MGDATRAAKTAAIGKRIRLRRHEVHALQIEGAATIVRGIHPHPVETESGLTWRPFWSKRTASEQGERWWPAYEMEAMEEGASVPATKRMSDVCPFGLPGERRYVQEAFSVCYAADYAEGQSAAVPPFWRKANCMPSFASRYAVAVDRVSILKIDGRYSWALHVSLLPKSG